MLRAEPACCWLLLLHMAAVHCGSFKMSLKVDNQVSGMYDTNVEAKVLSWFKALLNEDLRTGMKDVENQLRDGQILIRLAKEVQSRTPNAPEKAKKMVLKANTGTLVLKQMENIQNFLNFCESYGVPKTELFQIADLCEGANMARVLNCVQQLGSEAQRQGMDGPTIGPKPAEKNIRELGGQLPPASSG